MGDLGRDCLITLVHLLTIVGSSHPICGDVEVAGKPEV